VNAGARTEKGCDITVIVCTYNRCDSLADTLDSLARMDVPGGVGWEAIVVDNNSSDQTRQTALSFADRLPLRYLFEAQQGLSHARNCGVRATDSEFIAFTDDDVLVDRAWLARIVAAFRARQADCVGGKVLPHWLGERPRWLHDDLLNVLAMLDYGNDAFEFSWPGDGKLLYGANFAFRRDLLLELGLFNVELGRKGASGAGEDKDIFEKLLASGRRAVYEPGIVVRHKVFPDRLSKQYFRRWYYSAGRDSAKLRATRKCRFTVFGIESFVFRNTLSSLWAMLASLVRGERHLAFVNELRSIAYLSFVKHKLFRQ
jgi:glycosyltransferase involved in cell wall biosynthesis